MKKVIMITLIAAFAAFAGYNIYSGQKNDTLSDLALNNIEALANDESGGGTVTCYSSSRSKSGATYYDCGNCSKQYNSKGVGASSTCHT